MVRAWFAEHVKDIDVRIGGGWTYPDRYRTYVTTMQAWGEELKIPADDVERRIFLQQQDATQEPWRQGWSSAAADPEADELLEALRLALADLGAGDDGEPHLQALEDVIADAENEARDEAWSPARRSAGPQRSACRMLDAALADAWPGHGLSAAAWPTSWGAGTRWTLSSRGTAGRATRCCRRH
ncbi:hypothetical protein GY12_02770 [Micrococcus luteus]|nr:hypothetical protein GY12_02770 [Micrococcus luteus]